MEMGVQRKISFLSMELLAINNIEMAETSRGKDESGTHVGVDIFQGEWNDDT